MIVVVVVLLLLLEAVGAVVAVDVAVPVLVVELY